MIQFVVSIMLAYILDLLIGDPVWVGHPVRIIGAYIVRFEALLRRKTKNERLGGIILAVGIIGGVYIVSLSAIYAASCINAYLGFAVSTFLIYSSLAIKDLKVESMRVYHDLEAGRTDSARKNLSMIVGRDTKDLNEKDMIRATVETVAENIVDGIVSPLFYALLGGAPLALAYKAVNTLDSMVGYKNQKYKDFGWASAKIDDCVNFIPARISAILVPLAAWFARRDAISSYIIMLRDGGNNPSPNSGIPEAAVAGALGIRLGGLNYYNGTVVAKPFIGDDKNPLKLAHIKDAIRIVYISALLAVILIIVCRYIIFMIGHV